MDINEITNLLTQYNQFRQKILDIIRVKFPYNCITNLKMEVYCDVISVEFDVWYDSKCYEHTAMIDINTMEITNLY